MGSPLFATKPIETLMNEAGESGEHCLKRLYLFLCDAWRADCVDYRVGPDPRIRIWRGDRGGRLERPPASVPARRRMESARHTDFQFHIVWPAGAIEVRLRRFPRHH